MFVIRTNHDTQTNYLYSYTKPIIKLAEQKGIKVTIIENEEISEQNLRKRIKSQKPKLIFFNGHGTEDAIYNYYDKPFINSNSSDVFKETITFARACDCVNLLGKKAVDRGCLAFIGYRNKFFVSKQHNATCKPEQDRIAKPVLDCSNIVMNELIKGKTVDEAVNKAHEFAADQILKLIYSEDPWFSATLRALIYNDKGLHFEGRGEAIF